MTSSDEAMERMDGDIKRNGLRAYTMSEIASLTMKEDRLFATEPSTFGPWKFDPKYMLLNHSSGYQVDLFHVDGPSGVMRWLSHIGRKSGRFDDESKGALLRFFCRLFEDIEEPTADVLDFQITTDLTFGFPDPLSLDQVARPGVYMMKAGDHVKIGRAQNVAQRKRELQTGNPLPIEVIEILSENPADEGRWLRRVARAKGDATGEWFVACNLVACLAWSARSMRNSELNSFTGQLGIK